MSFFVFRGENSFVPNLCCPLAALQTGAKPRAGVSHLAEQPHTTGHRDVRGMGFCPSWDGNVEAVWRKAVYFHNLVLS